MAMFCHPRPLPARTVLAVAGAFFNDAKPERDAVGMQSQIFQALGCHRNQVFRYQFPYQQAFIVKPGNRGIKAVRAQA